ncbi:uncharacterized protein LOC132339065 [Haemorhous mexicanus]|uniref:uncharacterized protein LOC132339065 n=1 Tax=Haemorhous mexicanus TaxID=30427 RepID=UPI0028BEEB89|nr:uncharacterized protein LOC132339065 [Haemorhous mexicanus]
MHLAYLILTVFLGQLLGSTGQDTVTQEDGAVTVKQGQPFHTTCKYHSSYFTALLWYQLRKGQAPQLISYQAGTGPRPSGRITTYLNTTSKSSVLRLEEVELSDTALYLCAVQDTLVQRASSAVQQPRAGRGCVSARLSLGKDPDGTPVLTRICIHTCVQWSDGFDYVRPDTPLGKGFWTTLTHFHPIVQSVRKEKYPLCLPGTLSIHAPALLLLAPRVLSRAQAWLCVAAWGALGAAPFAWTHVKHGFVCGSPLDSTALCVSLIGRECPDHARDSEHCPGPEQQRAAAAQAHEQPESG